MPTTWNDAVAVLHNYYLLNTDPIPGSRLNSPPKIYMHNFNIRGGWMKGAQDLPVHVFAISYKSLKIKVKNTGIHKIME